MCLNAIYRARLERICFANARQDTAEIGFDDAFLYAELARPDAERALPARRLLRPRGARRI